MAEYIDREKLQNKISKMIDYCQKDFTVRGLTALFQVADAVMDCPSEDVAPVVRSKWNNLYDTDILFENTYECDNCKQTFVFEEGPEMCNANYCPNCGARMNGKEKSNDTQGNL